MLFYLRALVVVVHCLWVGVACTCVMCRARYDSRGHILCIHQSSEFSNAKRSNSSMSPQPESIKRALFFQSVQGRQILCCLREPMHQSPRAWVLHLPAFAEEMNKSRHMVTLMSERLALAGFGVMVFDPSGTGDSSGDFSDARLSHWHAELRALIDHLQAIRPLPLFAWGLRFGNLLLNAFDEDELAGALLWQPMASGKELINQTLRLRVMSSRMEGVEGESAKALKARLEAGQVLEVAGYGLHPEMVGGLEQLSFGVPGAPSAWMELSKADALPPGRQKLLEGLSREPELHLLEGEPFWSTAEIATAPSLLDASEGWIRQQLETMGEG
ncbi:MAG: hydrolase 2, exosortase A system-associated [Gammaproteobacteria bacterium]